MPISRMLVATDGSSGGGRAVTAAAEMAKALDCDLLIVTLPENTLPPAKWSELARAEGGVAEGLELLETRILVEAKERAESIGVAKVRTSSGSGDVAEAIMDMARRERTDIIVVGRRGRGQLAGLLLGSVSQKLVSLAPSLVLVVP